MKKTLLIFLIASIVLSLTSGCTANDTKTPISGLENAVFDCNFAFDKDSPIQVPRAVLQNGELTLQVVNKLGKDSKFQIKAGIQKNLTWEPVWSKEFNDQQSKIIRNNEIETATFDANSLQKDQSLSLELDILYDIDANTNSYSEINAGCHQIK